MQRLPQVLINVPGVDKCRADSDPALLAAVAEAGERARRDRPGAAAAVRTESLVRVMVEAATYETADEVASRLADVVKDSLGLASPLAR